MACFLLICFYFLSRQAAAVSVWMNSETAEKKTDVIVLDPGHGGSDPGMIGIDGLEEKGINLSVSLLLKEKLEEKGCPKVTVFDLARDDMAKAVEDAFRYGKLVLATITYNGDIFPFMRTYIENLTERSYQNRTIGLIENGSWAPAAARIMQGMFEKSKNITWLENNVKITSSLSEANEAEIEAMAEELCK